MTNSIQPDESYCTSNVSRCEEARATHLSKLTVRAATLTELPGKESKSNNQPAAPQSFLPPVKSASGGMGASKQSCSQNMATNAVTDGRQFWLSDAN